MKWLVIILGLTLASPAFADGGGDGRGSSNGSGETVDEGSDHDRALDAVERHEILPLQRVLAEVRKTYGGQLIDVELEQRQGRYFYELKLIAQDGRILEVEIDAATGRATGGHPSEEDD